MNARKTLLKLNYSHFNFQSTRCLSMNEKYFCIKGINFREAISDDVQQICTLSRIAHKDWYSTDYLPGWLPKVLKDPNRTTCVAEKDNQIVAFGMLLAGADDGESVLGEAGRTHPGHIGQGLLNHIYIKLVHQANEQWPNWQNCYGSNILRKYFEADLNAGRIQLLLDREYIRITCPSVKHIRDLMQPTFTDNVHDMNVIRMSEEEFHEHLDDSVTAKVIFPEGYIPVGYNIFRAVSSNIPFITYFHDNIFRGKDLQSISIGGGFPCNDERSWRYNFNYSGKLDFETVLEHLNLHFKICAEEVSNNKDIQFILMIPKEFNEMFGESGLISRLKDSFCVSNKSILYKHQYMYNYHKFKEEYEKNKGRLS